jgi:DNA-binding MarR family transcriptional regulator
MSKPAETLPLNDLSDEIGSYSLRLMWQLRQRAARAFEPLGFRTTRVLVLECIAQGYTQPKDLHQALGLVPPAISTIIAELEGRGLLERQSDPRDGRRINLNLTPAGETARQQLQEAWLEARRDLNGSLSPKDQATSLRLLQKTLDEPLD